MAEIPSVGDILLLSQSTWKVGRAFMIGRQNSPPEFVEIETEVNGLAKALKSLAEAFFADGDNVLLKQTTKETRTGITTILASCERVVKDLDSLIDQYQVIKKHRTSDGFAIERSWTDHAISSFESIPWTAEGGDIGKLLAILRVHTSIVTLTTQALESKSLARVEESIFPMAEKVSISRYTSKTANDQLEDIHHLVMDIARRASAPLPSLHADNCPQGSVQSGTSLRDSYNTETVRDMTSACAETFHSPPLPPPTSPLPKLPTSTSSPAAGTTSSQKWGSEFSYSGSTIRFSGSSDGASSYGWPSPDSANKSTLSDRQTSVKKVHRLPSTPEILESFSESNVDTLTSLPPPVIDVESMDIEKPMSGMMRGNSPTSSKLESRHRSSTTASQEAIFERHAFRNSAILCDVRCTHVEYAQKTSSDDPDEVAMVTACEPCRVLVVRKREPVSSSSSTVQTTTSIWTFSDDNTVRMQLRISEDQFYVPYSSYFNANKISITVPCELKFHDVKYGSRLLRTVKTSWVNYVFDNSKGAIMFQNELMGRTLLATYPTSNTMRLHEGFSGAFSYAEQMCGMENLRIWEDDETLAVIALIHFSAQFRNGYLAFYLNSIDNPIKVKDEGGTQVKIKGLRVPLEKKEKGRKDSAISTVSKDSNDRKKFITGCRVEFENEEDKIAFMELAKDVQKIPRELPSLLGVN